MRLISLELESKLRDKGLWPQSWIAWAALYVLALDLLLFAVQWLTRRASPATSASLEGWVTFLSALAIVLLAFAGFRWLCRNFRHRNSPAQHGGSQPSHCQSPGVANFGRWKARCGNARPDQAASSGVGAAAG